MPTGDPYGSFIEQLRKLVDEGNKSDIERRQGITRRTLINFAHGRSAPDTETIRKLSQYFNIFPPRTIRGVEKRGPSREVIPMFYPQDVISPRPIEIPDVIEMSEDEARIVLTMRDTSNPYWGLNAAVEMLSLAKDALPESDDSSRRAIIAAIGILSPYSR